MSQLFTLQRVPRMYSLPTNSGLFVTLVIACVAAQTARATQIDVPGAVRTEVLGVSGGTVVGVWDDSEGTQRGFVYDGATYTTIDHPDSVSVSFQKTLATGIDGNTVVGYYATAGAWYGYRYDVPTGNFTATEANRLYTSIEGTTIVGIIGPTQPWSSFIDSDLGTFTVTHPDGVNGTLLYGHSGGRSAGVYRDASDADHGFMHEGNEFDGEIFTPIAYPTGDLSTVANISGSIVVGSYRDASLHRQGFLYDGSTYSSYSYPGATHTRINDIDGNLIVGYFSDSTGGHGFIAQIPEPSTLCLAIVAGTAWLFTARRCRSTRKP